MPDRFENDLAFIEGLRAEVAGDKDAAVKSYERCVERSPHETDPYQLARRALDELKPR